MKTSHASHIKYIVVLVLLFALRTLSLIPEAIDVDEAWFAASGAALEKPTSFLQRALDNKPPGTIWLYWILNQWFQTGSDPRAARLVCILFVFAGALLTGRTVTILEAAAGLLPRANDRSRASDHAYGREHLRPPLSHAGWLAAIIVVISSALPSPELFATTSEALMLPLVCGLFLILVSSWVQAIPLGTASAGVCALALDGCFLLKQTGLLFFPLAFYGLYALRKKGLLRIEAMLAFAVMLVLPLASSIFFIGIEGFWYWVWVYPSSVLNQARSDHFSVGFSFVVRSAIFALILWPCVLSVPALFHRRSLHQLPTVARNLLALWLAGALGSVVLGRGLFFHYFIPLAPLLAISLALNWSWQRPAPLPRRGLAFMAACHGLLCLMVSSPALGVLWGTDLGYYRKVGAVVERLTKATDRIFLWGGTPLTLVMSHRLHATRFVTSRFVMPPYGIAWTRTSFRMEFDRDKPTVVVDLHKRGDDKFNLPPDQLPWLRQALNQNYEAFHEPGLPWAVFYVRKGILVPPPGIPRRPIMEFNAVYQDLIEGFEQSYEQPMGSAARAFAADLIRFRSHGFVLLPLFRAWEGLRALVDLQAHDRLPRAVLAMHRAMHRKLQTSLRRHIRVLTGEHAPSSRFIDEDLRLARDSDQWLESQFRRRGLERPMSMGGFSWWGSLALVAFQPKLRAVESADLF